MMQDLIERSEAIERRAWSELYRRASKGLRHRLGLKAEDRFGLFVAAVKSNSPGPVRVLVTEPMSTTTRSPSSRTMGRSVASIAPAGCRASTVPPMDFNTSASALA